MVLLGSGVSGVSAAGSVARQSFRCPQCAGSEAWLTNTGHLKCRRCRRRTSLTAGTIFERTQKPLRVWFQAMWYLTSQKSGGSALGLQQVLGLGSYQTAWSWLHKLRRAMVRPGRDRLNGCVEVDETCAGGEEEGVRGRQTEDKAIVVAAAEQDDGFEVFFGSTAMLRQDMSPGMATRHVWRRASGLDDNLFSFRDMNGF